MSWSVHRLRDYSITTCLLAIGCLLLFALKLFYHIPKAVWPFNFNERQICRFCYEAVFLCGAYARYVFTYVKRASCANVVSMVNSSASPIIRIPTLSPR